MPSRGIQLPYRAGERGCWDKLLCSDLSRRNFPMFRARHSTGGGGFPVTEFIGESWSESEQLIGGSSLDADFFAGRPRATAGGTFSQC